MIRSCQSWNTALLALALTFCGIGVPRADVTRDLGNITPLLSMAGFWTPTGATNPTTHARIGLGNLVYSPIRLPNGRYGVALDGWSRDGSVQPNTTFHTVNAALLEQSADGTLSIATDKYISDPVTNGTQSVLVADFNGDGMPDIFLAAHNESPFVAKSSTAYMSTPAGTFTKVVVNDPVMAHDAMLATIKGRTVVLTAGFYERGVNDYYSKNYYTFGPGNTVTTHRVNSPIGGMSIAAADFDGDGQVELVVGDLVSWTNHPGNPSDLNSIGVFRFDADASTANGEPLLLEPYFNTPAYANVVSLFGAGNTHIYRLRIDDFNHDGKPDILGLESLFPHYYAMLQMFQNTGTNGQLGFADRTKVLNPDYSENSQELDYAMQLHDIDGSGIKTYFLAGAPSFVGFDDRATKSNYILLNDGTGRLHVYLHDQFQTIADQINAWVARTQAFPSVFQPKFIEYLTPDNKINLVAVVNYNEVVGSGNNLLRLAFINVPLRLDPVIDFTKNITILDRNGSHLIRTFAGDDTIHRSVADPDCSIDGGLGTNTVVYPGTRDKWIVTDTGGSVTVRPASGTGGVDTLKRIQFARFDDVTLSLGSPASEVPNYTALWWNPAESGWGLNLNHQGNTLFGTLFTYESSRAPMWLVMSDGVMQSDGLTFRGDLYRTTGPAFNANPFTPIGTSNLTKVGTMTVSFAGINTATLGYTVNGVNVTKNIERQVFGTRAANCRPTTASRTAATNYQDLWWNAAESGWGINLTHQDSTIFATLFTYDATGKGLWLVMSSGTKQADGSYSGTLYRTAGPAFDASPFTPIGANDITNVGTMRLAFTDGTSGTLSYTYNNTSVTKTIKRQEFASPLPNCN